jgi:hypothetical protein
MYPFPKPGRHRAEPDDFSVAFTVESDAERQWAIGCLWQLSAAGIAGLCGLILAIAGNSGPSKTEPAHPVPVSVPSPAGVISWRLPTLSP